MNKAFLRRKGLLPLVALLLAVAWASPASAVIDGISGTTFNFTAKTNHISCADGLAFQIWGFANEMGPAQYPGPTLIIDQGDPITINLTNDLSDPVSMVFPGQASPGAVELAPPSQAGLLALEALPGGTVTYSFTASEAGTYYYQSGTDMDKQIMMGLFGAIIVRPTGFDP